MAFYALNRNIFITGGRKNPDFKIGSQPKEYDTDYRPNCKWIVNDLSVRIN